MSVSDRKPAPGDLADISNAFCRYVDVALHTDDGREISSEQFGKMMSAATHLFVEKAQPGTGSPFGANTDVTATEVMIMVSAMLGALNLEPFELAMWQSWSGFGHSRN